jgi:glycerol-3-phosphate dehydrogenase
MNSLSSLHRAQTLQQLQEDPFDLVVIGGGITGAGIALDASSRGLKVALIEKNDFASGTSSKSTKLIHGGLRYLKQFEIKLVREVGRERATVHRLAPHLVRPEKMLLPLIEGGSYGQLATSMGLWVYDVLAGVEGSDKRKMLDVQGTLKKEPLLAAKKDILKGAGYYAEYRTDDARLTIENIKTAVQHGATVANYVSAFDFIYENGQITGIQCKDELKGGTFNIQTKFVVSAAGPWVDTLRSKNHSLEGKRLFLSKGVHIVVPHEKLPIRQAVYFDVPDGRMIFAIPRQRVTYIGTTDTPYDGDPNHIPINEEDVNYLVEAVNNMFPDHQISAEDMESSWAGLRPLIYEEGKSASEMSRRDEIFESETGLISIAGGKLTGYRKMAERIVDLISKKYQEEYQKDLSPCQTPEIVLSGGPFKDFEAVNKYTEKIGQALEAHGLGPAEALYLVSNYGQQTNTILQLMGQHNNSKPEKRMALAEAQFCIEQEASCRLTDFFNRRTGRLYFDLPSVDRVREEVIDFFGEQLNWDAARLEEEKTLLEKEIQLSRTITKAVS